MEQECRADHRYEEVFRMLPHDQGGAGRHKCAGCAYDRGFRDGQVRKEAIQLGLESLPTSQAGTVRHKSPHAAWALGYMHGVSESYE